MTTDVLHDVLLPRLGPVRKIPSGYQARCPAHEDHNPSLSITEGSTQPVVINCHAGCDTGAILSALGLTWADISAAREERAPDDEWTPAGPASAVYDYRDEHDELLFQVLRVPQPDGGKTFRQRIPDPLAKSGWRWSLGDTRKVLYRLPQLIAAIDSGQTVWVCYAEDTEVLTPNGWVLMAKLADEAKVAQYDGGVVQFVEPVSRQVFAYTGSMVSLAADWSGLLVTPDHRVLCRWKNSRPVTIRAAEVKEQRWLPVAGVRPGDLHGPTDDEARLLAAWQADGVNTQRGHRVAWNLRKDRKKDRLRRLLTRLHIEWREQTFHSAPDWTYFTVDRRQAPVLNYLTDKRFGWDALDWPTSSRVALLDELGYWDGDRPGREGVRYFTADEQCAEVIAAVAATTGWGCITRRDDRPGRPEQDAQWVLSLVPRDWRTLGHAPSMEDYDGHVYCLTVPSGYLVTRRQGKVTVCGNCEGEKDVHSLVRAGVTATCNAGGAGKWHDAYTDLFVDAHVRVVADRDKPGQAHARMVTDSLVEVAGSVTIVEPAAGKDITDHLTAGRSLDEVTVTWASEQAATVDMAPDLHEFLATVDPPTTWVIPDLLERGDRLIWTGTEGTGKSMVTRMIGVAAAAGAHPFTDERFDPQRVLYIDCENSERQGRKHFRNLERVARLKNRRVPDGNMFIIHRPAGIDLSRPDDAAWLLERVTAHAPDLLICGPFYRLHAADSEEERSARRVVAALDATRVQADCALIVEHHAPHGQNGTRALRPFGSSLLLRWPEMGMGIAPTDDEQPSRHVAVKTWRGNRDERHWPRALRWGTGDADWPWVIDEERAKEWG